MNRGPHIRVVALALAVMLTSPLGALPAHAQDASAQAIPKFTISGAGWGHSIGMSQYGAKGFAELGKSGEWITAHYFPGTKVESNSDKSRTVNLDKSAVYASSSSSYNAGYTRLVWRVRPGYAGGTMTLNGSTTLSDRIWTIEASGTSFTVVSAGESHGPYTSITLAPGPGSPPLTQVTDACGPYDHTYLRFRGTLRISINTADIRNSGGAVTRKAGYLKLLNTLSMNDYLYGVVPRESPASWPHEALVAQALTARSYAYNGSSELYCTTMSQVYNGHSRGDRVSPTMHEDPRSNAAVDETTGRYVKYAGRIITTFFHSSSGGHTANIEDVWLGTGEPSSAYPYRRGVPSPYEGDRSWGPIAKTGLEIGAALKAKDPSSCPAGAGTSVWVTKIVPERVASGHVKRMDVYWSNGYVTSGFPGDSFRSALSLKSTRYYFNGFPMTRLQGATRYDTAVQVSRSAFPTTSPAVVLASGEDFADALAGSALAGAADGSLLLTQRAELPESVRLEMVRLRPSRVYLLGGASAVTTGVLSSVTKALPSADATRIAGINRFETAAKVAEVISGIAEPARVFVVSGVSWPDAASASAIAYAKGYPILLTPRSGLGVEAKSYLAAHRPAMTYVGGGPKALDLKVDAEIASATGGSVKRFSGSDRYDTARLIAERSLSHEGFALGDVYVATGAEFADALTGAVAAGAGRKPLLLTGRDTCAAATRTFLLGHRAGIDRLVLLGGPAAISEKGAGALDSVMMN